MLTDDLHTTGRESSSLKILIVLKYKQHYYNYN